MELNEIFSAVNAAKLMRDVHDYSLVADREGVSCCCFNYLQAAQTALQQAFPQKRILLYSKMNRDSLCHYIKFCGIKIYYRNGRKWIPGTTTPRGCYRIQLTTSDGKAIPSWTRKTNTITKGEI